jgi:hypothetical protein
MSSWFLFVLRGMFFFLDQQWFEQQEASFLVLLVQQSVPSKDIEYDSQNCFIEQLVFLLHIKKLELELWN